MEGFAAAEEPEYKLCWIQYNFEQSNNYHEQEGDEVQKNNDNPNNDYTVLYPHLLLTEKKLESSRICWMPELQTPHNSRRQNVSSLVLIALQIAMRSDNFSTPVAAWAVGLEMRTSMLVDGDVGKKCRREWGWDWPLGITSRI
ncbi:hypothetical protein Fot_33102 [Forsythia ovata]|uniref:Uncharacterized protein n=1 Tax=Forsythia ovata TaxID=205694 RepID=A0ABD1T9T7_9LAMI